MAGRVRVYIASSLDGFIAGPGNDISWLDHSAAASDAVGSEPGVLTYDAFIADVGAVLMGRGTFDVVQKLGGTYGARPVLVASHRPLPDAAPDAARRVSGDIAALVRFARAAARGKDVYLDGGNLIRQAAEADLIDDLTITLAPIALGAGHPLFAGMEARYPLEITGHYRHPGGMVQIQARPRSRPARA